MIFVVDFGSQTAHLISRRIKEFGVDVKIVNPEKATNAIIKNKSNGIILSGGPSSVYEKNAPSLDKNIFGLNIPILGICYGFQLTAKLLGGKVIAGRKEYGPAEFKIQNSKTRITQSLPKKFTVWMSHGDEVVSLPKGFEVFGSTTHIPYAFSGNLKSNIFGVQFHPEVGHTEYGKQVLKNFINICKIQIKQDVFDIDKIYKVIKTTVGESYVIGAVSGGVDSTVAAMLTANAIGKKFIPVFVDNGLMRENTWNQVEKIFKKVGIKPKRINAKNEMLIKLRRISDPEEKRKIIGSFYIELFEKEMEKLLKKGTEVKFLLQGTIYSDVIESQGTTCSSKIKSHHNVGGLPKNMKLKLLEPIRNYYKDEVREIGRLLKLPDEFISRQPFPGPGYAIRIRGEVTKKRLKMEKQADRIVLEELKNAELLDKVFISFPVLTNSFSTAVKGDGRHFGEVVALRVVDSKDVMTSNWSRLPYDLLQKISSRIVNEVPNISRVVYDITTKPPATMEWE